MFLTILEDGGKTTRFWSELTTRTHHVKLPWEKQSSLNSIPAIFRVCHWDLLMAIVNQTFRGNWSFLDSKIYRWLSKEYVVQTSLSKIYGYNQNQKICVAVNTKNNFKFKKSNNEN